MMHSITREDLPYLHEIGLYNFNQRLIYPCLQGKMFKIFDCLFHLVYQRTVVLYIVVSSYRFQIVATDSFVLAINR